MEERRLLSRDFVLATVGNLLFFSGVTTFFVLPVHIESLGASPAAVGHVMGAFGVASMLAIPATGVFVDRFGRRPFMLGGALLWGATSLAFSAVVEIGPLLFLLRMVQGVAFALVFVSTNAMVVDLAPRGSLGRAISILGTTTLATHALGPAAGEIILHRWGFRTLCFASAASAALAMVAQSILKEVPPGAPPSGERGLSTGLLSLALRPRRSGALVAGFTSALAFGAALNFMPIFVESRHIPSFSPFFAAYAVAAAGVRLVAGGLGDRLGHRRVAAASLLVFATAVAGFSLVHRVPTLVLGAVVFGVAHGWLYPSLNALFVVGAPERARGSAMALYNLSFNVGVTVSAFVGGEIAERFGYAAMWLVMASSSALGVAALLLEGRRRERGEGIDRGDGA